jgi:myo-inositol-1(or 4)-monophosphatase
LITENQDHRRETSAARDELSQHLVKIASTAALKVGDMLVEAFRRGVSVREKKGFYDLVTEYDSKSEQMIVEHILEQYPDSRVVGEEQGAYGGGAVQWYVDPIDGTTNFATGLPLFCVSVAAALDQSMLAGVIYDPVRQELFSASTQGAFLNGRPIRARGGRLDSQAVLLTDFPYITRQITADDYGLLAQIVSHFRAVRRLGSLALELAYIACGRADVFFSSGSQAWDVAAGMLLVEQAGGRYLLLEPARHKAWPPVDCLVTCPEFDLEQSVLKALPVIQEG